MSQIQLILTLFICCVSTPLLINGQCHDNSCLNGGTCFPGYKGKGFGCRCPNPELVNYGPRCEWVSRGFYPRDNYPLSAVQTVHSLAGYTFHKKSLMITFQYFASGSPITADNIFLQIMSPDLSLRYTIRFTTSDSQDVLGAEVNATHIIAKSKVYFGKWTSVSMKVDVTPANKTKGSLVHIKVYYDGEITDQHEATSKDQIDLESDFINSALTVGSFDGCIRFVRVNNKLVDLGKVLYYDHSLMGPLSDNDAEIAKTFTSHICNLTQHECIQTQFGVSAANRSSKCGRNSMCDGAPSPYSSGDQKCSCKCETGKRREHETWINTCPSKLVPKDECIKNTPILSTASENYKVNWIIGKTIAKSRIFSIEFLLLTQEITVYSVLKFTSFHIKIANGLFEFCAHNEGKKEEICKKFPEIPVSDDVWHKVFVSVRGAELTLMIDMATQFYELDQRLVLKLSDCELEIPKSCITGFRLSDFYMPLNSSEVLDGENGDRISVQTGSGVSVGAECNFTLTGLTPAKPEETDDGKKSNDRKKHDDIKKLMLFNGTNSAASSKSSWIMPILLSLVVVGVFRRSYLI